MESKRENESANEGDDGRGPVISSRKSQWDLQVKSGGGLSHSNRNKPCRSCITIRRALGTASPETE